MQNYNSSATLAKTYKLLTAILLILFSCPFRLAAQDLQLSSGPVIVLDAGHGGSDEGARGTICSEKQITLSISKKIQSLLFDKMPEAAVYFTRQTDSFIPLHERAKMANDLDANYFISIHCNAMPGNHKQIRGTETYVMGLHKAEENLAVAQRENAAILLESGSSEHYDPLDLSSPASFITLNHIQDEYMQKSIALARSIEDAFSKKHPGKSKGVKQAGFHVLHQVSMPCVLIETGYMTNPEEEKYLCSESGQWEIAEMIADGITNQISNKPVYPTIAMTDVTPKGGGKNPKKSDDYIYKIQLAAMKNYPPEQSKWRRNLDFEIIKDGEVYKVVYGSFLTAEDANKEKSELKRAGYKDAFVIKFLADKKVN
jgi:N-acetylmuramoyl-L-alanine amidase